MVVVVVVVTLVDFVCGRQQSSWFVQHSANFVSLKTYHVHPRQADSTVYLYGTMSRPIQPPDKATPLHQRTWHLTRRKFDRVNVGVIYFLWGM